nr:glutathione S-transferase [Candidatus Pantoea persica]
MLWLLEELEVPYQIKRYQSEASMLAPHRQMIEQQLASQPWFAGKRFSIADIQMSFSLLAMQSRGGLTDMSSTAAWLATLQQRAIEQGGGVVPAS